MNWNQRHILNTVLLVLVLLLVFTVSLAQDSAGTLTVNIPNGVNVRNLSDREVDGAFPRGETPVIGWFDAASTPFASLAGGLWLVIGEDGEHAVLASLVRKVDGTVVANAEAAATREYVYFNRQMMPADEVVLPTPVPTLRPEDIVFPEVPDEVTVGYIDRSSTSAYLTDGTPLEYIEQTVAIASESLLPVPLGILERGQFPAIDHMVRWEAGDRAERQFPERPIAGILLDIVVEDSDLPDQKQVYLLTQTPGGNWAVMYIRMAPVYVKLVPVDANLNLPTTPVEDIPYVEVRHWLSEDDDKIRLDGGSADVVVGEEVIMIVVMQDQYSNKAGYITWRANYLMNGIKGKTMQEDASEWESEGASILEIMEAIDNGRLDPNRSLIFGKAMERIFFRQD